MIYAFETCELDTDRGELRRNGDFVTVEPQVFKLLHVLLESRDKLLSRDEIFDAIWGRQIVSDATLTSRLRDARKAIGDDGRQQRLIRTIPRRGLRFVGQVTERNVAPAAIAGQTGDSQEIITPENQILQLPALAVSPLECRSDARSELFQSEGLSKQIAAALSAWRCFPVLVWPRGKPYPRRPVPGSEHLNPICARYALTGSFQRLGKKVKVVIDLCDVELDQHIWSQTIVRSTDDLIALDEEIATQVATALLPELAGAEARRVLRRPATSLSVWEKTMRAAWLIERGEQTDIADAERLLLQTIESAPDWALPYSLLAIGKFQKAMAGFSMSDGRRVFSETLEAAKSAVIIDRSSWVGHALCAVGELWSNRDHERALCHLDRAIQLNPAASINYHFGGCIRGFAGDLARAKEDQEKLFRVDPTYRHAEVVEADLALWHMLADQLPEAKLRLKRAERWNPHYARAFQRKIALAGLQGERETALAAAAKLSMLGQPLRNDNVLQSYPFRNETHRDIFFDGLRRSGVNF